MANKETEASAAALDGGHEQHHRLVPGAGAPEVKLVRKALSALPPHAVKEVLSLGICGRCLIRTFGDMESITSCMMLSTSVMTTALGEVIDLEDDAEENSLRENQGLSRQNLEEIEPQFCRICLGILQFAYCNAEGLLMKKECTNEFAVLIAEAVKQEGHQVDSFSLEVSVPPVISENEEMVWLHMKRMYCSQLWFSEKSFSGRSSVKDVLKMSIKSPLETLLESKSGPSSIHIRLTYSHYEKSIKVQNSFEIKACSKRRKTVTGSRFERDDNGADPPEISDLPCGKEDVSKRSCSGLLDHESHDDFEFFLGKVNQPCQLTFLCYRTAVYIGGRYLKYSRNVSQTQWIIDDERMGEASVEEIIGNSILPLCKGDNYKFHAAGREDIDVRMLGSGRPFLVEIQNARHVPSKMALKETEVKINSQETKLVGVKSLKLLDSKVWTLMREGEEEKQKQYAALVWISRPLKDDDLKTLSTLKDMPVFQRTPIRVLHRRSPLDREKIIHWMKVEIIAGSSQYFLLHLCTQAGTYIKEFVHGDLGRTHPSIGSILGCRAEILQLDVTDVKMDCFLPE